MTELTIMTDRQFELLLFCESDEMLCIWIVEREWFFHVDIAPTLQTRDGNLEVTIRRRCDMRYIRPAFVQQFREARKISVDSESFGELSRHEAFRVTDRDDLAAGDSLNLGGMGVGDLAAPHDRYSKHVGSPPGRLEKIFSTLHP